MLWRTSGRIAGQARNDREWRESSGLRVKPAMTESGGEKWIAGRARNDGGRRRMAESGGGGAPDCGSSPQ